MPFLPSPTSSFYPTKPPHRITTHTLTPKMRSRIPTLPPLSLFLCFVNVTSALLPPTPLTPLPPSCATYPSYNATTLAAGPFTLVAEAPGAPVNGTSASLVSFTNDGKDRYGFVCVPSPFPLFLLRVFTSSLERQGESLLIYEMQVTIPLTNPNFAAPVQPLPVRCVPPGRLQARSGADTWVGIGVAAEENWQGALAFGLDGDGGESLAPYARVQNGTRVGGVYIGWEGRVRWVYKHNWGGNAGEYFLVRLAGEEGMGKRQDGGGGPSVDDRDWVGWLRVEG